MPRRVMPFLLFRAEIARNTTPLLCTRQCVGFSGLRRWARFDKVRLNGLSDSAPAFLPRLRPLECRRLRPSVPAADGPCPRRPGKQKQERRPASFPRRFAAALAYFSFIPAILFLSIEPYNKNQFVRYHSAQCLLVWAAAILVAIVLKLVGLVLFLIPVAGPLLVFLTWVVAGLAALLLWLVLIVKAFQGEVFQLPLLGNIAERYAPVIQH